MSCLNLPIILNCILFCYLFILFSLVSSLLVLCPRPKHLGPMDPSLLGPHVLGAHRQATDSWPNLVLPSAQPKMHVLCRLHCPCVLRHTPCRFVPFHGNSWRPNGHHSPPTLCMHSSWLMHSPGSRHESLLHARLEPPTCMKSCTVTTPPEMSAFRA